MDLENMDLLDLENMDLVDLENMKTKKIKREREDVGVKQKCETIGTKHVDICRVMRTKG